METIYNGNGIWIPNEILHNQELTSTEKILYAEIYYLDRPDIHCTASNEYFSEFLNMSESGVKKCLNHLRELGYIYTASFDGRKRSIAVSVKWINQTDTPVSVRQTQEEPSEGYKNEFLLIRENRKENSIEKAPEPVPSSKINSRRNFRNEHEQLEDVLESGKDIEEQKKVKKKMSEYDKCLAEIDKRNFSDEEKSLLRQHLEQSYYSKDPKRIRDRSNYVNKLNMLEQLVKKGNDCKKVVQQSIDRQWSAFYEYSEKQTTQQHEPLADKVGYRSAEEAQRELDELRAKGAKHY